MVVFIALRLNIYAFMALVSKLYVESLFEAIVGCTRKIVGSIFLGMYNKTHRYFFH